MLLHQHAHGVVARAHEAAEGLQPLRADPGVLVAQDGKQGLQQPGMVQPQLHGGVAGDEPQRRARLALGLGVWVGEGAVWRV